MKTAFLLAHFKWHKKLKLKTSDEYPVTVTKKHYYHVTPQQIKEDFIMSNYPLWKRDKSNPEILTPQNSFYSEEYCENHFDLYLTTHLYKNENGKFQKY